MDKGTDPHPSPGDEAVGPKEKRRSQGAWPREDHAGPSCICPTDRQCAHSACGSPAHQRGGSCKYGVGGSPPLGAASPQRGLAVLPGAARASASRPGTRPPATQAAPVRKDQAARAACERRSKGRCRAQMRPHSALCWRPRSLRPVPAAGEAPEHAPPEPPSAQQRPVRGRLRGALGTGLQAGHRTRRSRRRHARRFPERLDGTSRAAPRLGERSLCGAMHARREARFAS